RLGREIHLPGARAFDARNFRERKFVFAADLFGTAAGGTNQPRGQALLVIDQHLQQVLRQKLLIVVSKRERLGRLDEAPRPFGELLHIHDKPSRARIPKPPKQAWLASHRLGTDLEPSARARARMCDRKLRLQEARQLLSRLTPPRRPRPAQNRIAGSPP